MTVRVEGLGSNASLLLLLPHLQVRYDRKVGSSTSLKFMTDGILLREVQVGDEVAAFLYH